MARSKSKGVDLNRHEGSTSKSFGTKPPKIAVGGGEMCTFGFKTGGDTEVWPKNPVSTDQKTGFPKGFDGRKA